MAKRMKTGRRAVEADRVRAAGLAELYRRAQSSPDGCHCLNPEDEPRFQIIADVTDLDPLLDALERFAQHGTFALLDNFESFLMRIEMSHLLSAGMTYEEAIVKLAEDHHTSPSTITRRVRRTVKT